MGIDVYMYTFLSALSLRISIGRRQGCYVTAKWETAGAFSLVSVCEMGDKSDISSHFCAV